MNQSTSDNIKTQAKDAASKLQDNLSAGAIVLAVIISLVGSSFSGGVVFGISFTVLWILVLLMIFGLILLIGAIFKFLVIVSIIIFASTFVYALVTGQSILAMGLLSIGVAVYAFLFILGLYIIAGFLLPGLLVGVFSYFVLIPNNLLAAIILAAIAIVLTYFIIIKIALPFIIGFALTYASGQLAYLFMVFGFSLETLQKAFAGTLNLSFLSDFILKPSVLTASTVPGVIIAVSIIGGVSLVFSNFFGNPEEVAKTDIDQKPIINPPIVTQISPPIEPAKKTEEKAASLRIARENEFVPRAVKCDSCGSIFSAPLVLGKEKKTVNCPKCNRIWKIHSSFAESENIIQYFDD
jgi:hypothetical protein